MTIKLKTIKLSDGWMNPHSFDGEPRKYRVEQITDSMDFRTGDYLEKPQVANLCASREWKVTIIPRS